jgi:predicted small lipoprotein YifL
MRIIFWFLITTLLMGCGQTGGLYLPDPSQKNAAPGEKQA